MAYETFYSDDTSRLTLTAGSAAVTAETGLFAVWVRPGDRLIYKGLTAIIKSVESNTAFTLSRGWPGESAEGVTDWEIDRGPLWGSNVPIHTDVTEILRRIRAGIPFRPDAVGTLSDRANYDDAETGFIFQRVDVVPFELYVKNGDGWAGPETLKGDKGDKGDKGWSPFWGLVVDGARRILQVTGWQGGAGEAPATGQYIGAGGLVETQAEAIDIRGPIGDVTPAVTALVGRAETAAAEAGGAAGAAAGSAAAAAISATAAQTAASSIDTSNLVLRNNNGSDFENKDKVLDNLGGKDTGKKLFSSDTVAAVKEVLGRYTNADLSTVPARTIKGALVAGDVKDLTAEEIMQLLGFSPADFAPIGAIIDWAFMSEPNGWKFMHGQLEKRADYPRLWALVQSSGRLVSDAAWLTGEWGTFSSGDESTTFRFPDPRGEFIRVLDAGRNVDAGRLSGSHQDHALQDHKHFPEAGAQFVTNAWPNLTSWGPYNTGNLEMNGGGSTGGILTGNRASETRPRNIAWHKIIRVA